MSFINIILSSSVVTHFWKYAMKESVPHRVGSALYVKDASLICSGSSKRRPKSARNRGSQRLKPSGTRSRNNWRNLGRWRGMFIEFHRSRAIPSPHFAGMASWSPIGQHLTRMDTILQQLRTQHHPSIRWRTPLPTRLRTSAWDCRTWINGGRTTRLRRIENGIILHLAQPASNMKSDTGSGTNS